MKNRAKAARYARALAATLRSDEEFDQVQQQLKAVTISISHDELIAAAFKNPSISTNQKKALIHEVAEAAGLNPKLARYIELLVSNDRTEFLKESEDVFRQLRDDRLGVVEAELVTAVPMEASADRDWEQMLERITGKKVRLKKAVNPAIIGGAVARIGSVVYDGSVRSQLVALREKLISGS